MTLTETSIASIQVQQLEIAYLLSSFGVEVETEEYRQLEFDLEPAPTPSTKRQRITPRQVANAIAALTALPTRKPAPTPKTGKRCRPTPSQVQGAIALLEGLPVKV